MKEWKQSHPNSGQLIVFFNDFWFSQYGIPFANFVDEQIKAS